MPGKFGGALQFHGPMSLDYPTAGNVDISAGSVDFWVALSEDSAVIKNDPKLPNQLLWTLGGPGTSTVSVYYWGIEYAGYAIYNKEGQLAAMENFPCDWKKGEWHHIELRWGRQLEIWCDGDRKFGKEWSGLFGPLEVKTEALRMNFGSRGAIADEITASSSSMSCGSRGRAAIKRRIPRC